MSQFFAITLGLFVLCFFISSAYISWSFDKRQHPSLKIKLVLASSVLLGFAITNFIIVGIAYVLYVEKMLKPKYLPTCTKPESSRQDSSFVSRSSTEQSYLDSMEPKEPCAVPEEEPQYTI